jgi:hypothetical protein
MPSVRYSLSVLTLDLLVRHYTILTIKRNWFTFLEMSNFGSFAFAPIGFWADSSLLRGVRA